MIYGESETLRAEPWVRKKSSVSISGSRIDFLLTSLGLSNRIVDTQYEHGYKTDHSLFWFKIEMDVPIRGQGYWKFNKQLLYDKDFVSKANEIIQGDKIKYKDSSPDVRWECCKENLTNWAKEKSKMNAKIKKER